MARSFSKAGSDNVETATSATLNPSGAVTVAGWFKINTYNNLDAIFSLGASTPDSSGIKFFQAGGANKVLWQNFWNDGQINTATATASPNVWHHSAFSSGGSGNPYAAYLDGTSYSSGTTNAGGPTTNYALNAAYNCSTNTFGDVSIADLAAWTVSLTALEIAGLAAGMRPYQFQPLSLLAWLPIDGIQSPEPDLSGNKFNGTVTGTALDFGPPIAPFTPRWSQFPRVVSLFPFPPFQLRAA